MSELKRGFYPNAKEETNKLAITLLGNKNVIILSNEEGDEFYEFACQEAGRKLKILFIRNVTGRFPNSNTCWYYTYDYFNGKMGHFIRVVDESYFTSTR